MLSPTLPGDPVGCNPLLEMTFTLLTVLLKLLRYLCNLTDLNGYKACI